VKRCDFITVGPFCLDVYHVINKKWEARAIIRWHFVLGGMDAGLKPPGEEARVLGEEARRRLSGHGFSTEEREERRMSRSEFPRWGNERPDEPKPEPRWGEPTGLVPRGAGAGNGSIPPRGDNFDYRVDMNNCVAPLRFVTSAYRDIIYTAAQL